MLNITESEISASKVAIISIGVVIAILLLIIVILLIIKMTTQKTSRPVARIRPKPEMSRRRSSERSNSMYFQPNIAAGSSRVLVVTEDDISNYQNRYEVVLLQNLDVTKSVSMTQLSETVKEAKPERKPRRSLPADLPSNGIYPRYIDV